MKELLKCIKIVWNEGFIKTDVNKVNIILQEPAPINKIVIHQEKQETNSTTLTKANGASTCTTKPILMIAFYLEARKFHFEVIENGNASRTL